MKNKTESKIIEILNENDELKSYEIAKLVELTYDSIDKHLKRMTEEGKIIGTARGNPWYYHYQLNKNYKEK